MLNTCPLQLNLQTFSIYSEPSPKGRAGLTPLTWDESYTNHLKFGGNKSAYTAHPCVELNFPHCVVTDATQQLAHTPGIPAAAFCIVFVDTSDNMKMIPLLALINTLHMASILLVCKYAGETFRKVRHFHIFVENGEEKPHASKCTISGYKLATRTDFSFL